MAQFNVDAAQIAQASVTTSAIAGQIRSDVTQMIGQLQMLQGSWTGAAASAFADCATRWQAAQAQVEEVLNQISMALQAASRTYDDAEAQAASMFAG